jgi:RimJ/RimL family protein N-acetyltransferase
MSSHYFPLRSDRLELRLFDHHDLDAVCAYYLLPEAQRYLEPPARDRTDVRTALRTLCGQVALNRPGDTLALAVERQSDRTLVGQVCLRWHDATAAQGEIRFVFNPIYRRQGYARESVRAVLDLAFDELHFHRIFAGCDARSAASARLLKDLGMRLEAHYREHALFQGEWDEELHFAILDREWRRAPGIHEFGMPRVA